MQAIGAATTNYRHSDQSTASLSSFPVSGNGATFDLADVGTKRARALFDYDAMHPNEISIHKDEEFIVYRLPGLDPEYIMAEKGNLRGRIPLSYVEILK